LVGIGLTVALFMRQEIGLTVAPVRNPTFVTLSDGGVRNTYDVRLRNLNLEDRRFHISITSDAVLRVELEGTDELVVEVPANETLLQRVYVVAAPGSEAALAHATPLTIWVEDLSNTDRASKGTVFNGKGE
jgi:polyferredoxin